MSTVLEILYAYAAVATILSFLHDLWTEHKNDGRSREGTTEELKWDKSQKVCLKMFISPVQNA